MQKFSWILGLAKTPVSSCKSTAKQVFLQSGARRSCRAEVPVSLEFLEERRQSRLDCMAGMSRAYLVCKQCGPSSWIFQDRVGSNPFCQKCGCQWPKVHRQQPSAVSGAEWASRGSQPRVWKDKGPKVSRDRASAAPVGAAQKALSQVWAALPVTAQQAIEKAGWQPRSLSPPPGLGGKGNLGQKATERRCRQRAWSRWCPGGRC